MSSASEGVSDWANQGDGGVKILHLSIHSLTQSPTYSFIHLESWLNGWLTWKIYQGEWCQKAALWKRKKREKKYNLIKLTPSAKWSQICTCIPVCTAHAGVRALCVYLHDVVSFMVPQYLVICYLPFNTLLLTTQPLPRFCPFWNAIAWHQAQWG